MANTVFIADDGTITGLSSPLTEALGIAQKTRVSRVEPVHPFLKKLFYLIRNRVKDDSLLAGFTRLWPCSWQARIFYGPTLGPFKSRKAAIAAEIKWMNEELER